MLIQVPIQITGLILAGGLGRRLGGVDKGLQILNGNTLVAHVIERLAPQVDTLMISANRNPEIYAALGHPVVTDCVAGFAGPLAGLQAGLTACTTPLLALAPCDSPFLPLDLVDRLRKGLERDGTEIAVPKTSDGLQPVFALMRREVLPTLSGYLAAGGRQMQEWCRQLPLSVVDFSDASAFANINTPEELSASRHG